MVISDTSLRNSIFTEVKAAIEASTIQYYNNSNILDGSATITAAYTDNEDNLPEVVIHPANIAKDNFTFNRTDYTNNIQIMIDIYAKKMKNIDTITDFLDTITGLKSISGLGLVAWDETMAYSPENDNKIHLKTITLTYRRR